jgi:hypothetical protein
MNTDHGSRRARSEERDVLESLARLVEGERCSRDDARVFEAFKAAAATAPEPIRLRPWLACAAAIVLAASLALVYVTLASGGLEVRSVELSAMREPRRGSETPGRIAFKSGQRVYIHVKLAGSGTVFAALLNSKGELEAASDAAQTVQAAGPATVACTFDFVLDDTVGTESCIILATHERWADGDFKNLLARVNELERQTPEAPSREARLTRVLERLREGGVRAAVARTFDHVSRGGGEPR